MSDGQRPGVLLLVEDDLDHAFLVRRWLVQHDELGLQVVHLTTCAEATRRLHEGDVHCVLLDLTLPDARGMHALTALRDVDPLVPVVVLTGLDNDMVGVQALQAGAQDYLVKGQHAPDAVARSILFAIERGRRAAAEQAGWVPPDAPSGTTVVVALPAQVLEAPALPSQRSTSSATAADLAAGATTKDPT